MADCLYDPETKTPICPMCDGHGEPEHECPYSFEFGGDAMCTCCHGCQIGCAQDI